MLLELFLSVAVLPADAGDGGDETPAKPPAAISAEPSPGVEWKELAGSSLRFLALMHGYRLATEAGTRQGGFGFGSGYVDSVTNLHGWADGDPFYVNYVGHPMMGSVAGEIFQLHDRRYRGTEFGSSAAYWKGKLRAIAFAWAFSEQFEIGPLSEASIGHIQKDFPQQGFVDHVITPTVGMSWSIAEDSLDRYIIKSIEARTANPFARILARTTLNPARTFANLMDWRVPWYRQSRPGVREYAPAPLDPVRDAAASPPDLRAAPFELTASAGVRNFGGYPCIGGGGDGALRVAPEWQVVLAVGGCKLTGLALNVTGDALVYQFGPRWTPSPDGKWSPFAHFLVGGLKATQETFDPEEKQRVLQAHPGLDPSLLYTLHGLYTSDEESNALALTAGMGLDYRLNSALAIRVASLEYLRGSARSRPGSGFQMSTGIVLRWGTW